MARRILSFRKEVGGLPQLLSFYTTKFQTVEIDSTFYASPAASTVTGWKNKTPENFIITAKVLHEITHEKCLLECDEEFKQFVETMSSILGSRLGPLLLQFPYFNSEVFQSGVQFLSRLKAFVKKLPTDKKFAIEIRNKRWIKPQFLDLLREHNVAFVLQDQSWMPRPSEKESKHSRRFGIELSLIVRANSKSGLSIAYANNHYGGFGSGNRGTISGAVSGTGS